MVNIIFQPVLKVSIQKILQLNEELEHLNADKNSLYSDWEDKQLEYEDFDKN